MRGRKKRKEWGLGLAGVTGKQEKKKRTFGSIKTGKMEVCED